LSWIFNANVGLVQGGRRDDAAIQHMGVVILGEVVEGSIHSLRVMLHALRRDLFQLYQVFLKFDVVSILNDVCGESLVGLLLLMLRGLLILGAGY